MENRSETILVCGLKLLGAAFIVCGIIATVKGNLITGVLTLGVIIIVIALFGKKRNEERKWIKILGDKYPRDND